ncbi:MAG: FtsX-like permease family protein [Betaproteobacteria bacterium]
MTPALLRLLLWREWRHHPWRHATALLAVTLGVALAWSVHLINQSALAEFSAAVRAANGDADLSLRGAAVPEALFEQVAQDAAVSLASPVLEIDTLLRRPDGRRVAVRVIGLDLLRAAPLAPELLPRPRQGEDRLAGFDPDAAFANAAALAALGSAEPGTIELQSGPATVRLRHAGSVAAGGTPVLVMDLAGAQGHFGAITGGSGRLTRIDLRLAPGTDAAAWARRLALPEGVRVATPGADEQRVSNLSRAYRVNLTVLALVALFVGAFLVFSVVSLGVAQRAPALALLGVLGLSAAQRRGLVLAECAALGAAGGLLGLLAGTAMAAAALRWMAGDLGGGYFPGIAPRLQVAPLGVVVFGALGLVSALVGGWWPARQAEQLAPAQALKGLGTGLGAAPPAWPGLALVAAGALAALAPPVAGLPLAAYAAVALLLVGGVALIPATVHALLARWPRPQGALALLALQRARHQRATATAAVAGVVASLALSVAITVMVASFRDGVARWLDTVLPADLYARTAASSASADQAWLPPGYAASAAAVPGVLRVEPARVQPVVLDESRPAVVLVARPLADPAAVLPLLAAPLPAPEGAVGVFVSEALVSLYGAAPGQPFVMPVAGTPRTLWVRGVWRDYARQFGTVVMDAADFRRLGGDDRVNDLALWLAPGAAAADVQQALREALRGTADPGLLEFASSAELRQLSLRIFDRSFAVTHYLQVVAIAIGLVGIAASLSAQVLARRKEVGLLAHLGLVRGDIVRLVAAEALAWVAAGVLMGLALGVAISLVLVFVVNPQSFHWTMDLVLPWARLAGLALAVLAAGVATAALTARNAARAPAVRAVREDW